REGTERAEATGSQNRFHRPLRCLQTERGTVTSPSVCIPNIGPRERRRRLVGGFVFLLITACVAGCLIWFEAPRPWRLLVFLPAWASAIGFFQVTEKTCVALAARGLRNLDSGDEAITDALELARI